MLHNIILPSWIYAFEVDLMNKRITITLITHGNDVRIFESEKQLLAERYEYVLFCSVCHTSSELLDILHHCRRLCKPTYILKHLLCSIILNWCAWLFLNKHLYNDDFRCHCTGTLSYAAYSRCSWGDPFTKMYYISCQHGFKFISIVKSGMK